MSSRLLAATLLALGLAGPALAAGAKELGPPCSTADLVSPLPSAKPDAGAWSAAEPWTVLSSPASRAKSSFTAPAADDAGNAVTTLVPKSPVARALADETGALPSGFDATNKTNNASLSVGTVFGLLSYRKLLQAL